jgi:hypothetical protein
MRGGEMVEVFDGECGTLASRLTVLTDSEGHPDNGNRYVFRIRCAQLVSASVPLADPDPSDERSHVVELEVVGDWEAMGIARLFAKAEKAVQRGTPQHKK